MRAVLRLLGELGAEIRADPPLLWPLLATAALAIGAAAVIVLR